MKVKFKKIYLDAEAPKRQKIGDAGSDLTVHRFEVIDYNQIKYYFGISVEIPEGYVGLLFPRSSIYKKQQILSNSVGVIDSNFRGEISAVMVNTTVNSYTFGERAAQLIIIPYPMIEFVEAKELSETERGENGYGSSGN